MPFITAVLQDDCKGPKGDGYRDFLSLAVVAVMVGGAKCTFSQN